MEFIMVFWWVWSVVKVRNLVPGESPMTVDMNVLPVVIVLLLLRESPVHHGIPGDVIASVGVDKEIQADIMESW